MPSSRLLFLVICFFLSVVFSASFYMEVDQVIRTEARVEPVGRAFKLQSRYPGIVREVNVELGDKLREGQVAFSIDPEGSADDILELEYRLADIRAKKERLSALISERRLQLPEDLPLEIAREQTLLYDNLVNSLNRSQGKVEKEMAVNRFEQQEVLQRLSSLQVQVGLILKEIELLKPLVEKNIEPDISLLQLQRTLAGLEGEVQAAKSSIARLSRQQELIEIAQNEDVEALKTDWQQELIGLQSEAAQVRSELAKATQRLESRVLQVPFAAVVAKLVVTRPGTVVREGDPLAEVVPLDSTYVVVAKLSPVNVANVSVGQAARLTLSAYDFADFGHVDVQVTEIARNLTEPENAEPFYEVLLRLDAPVFAKSKESVEILPGMLGQVEFLKDPISVFEYVTKPVQKAGSVALTEY